MDAPRSELFKIEGHIKSIKTNTDKHVTFFTVETIDGIKYRCYNKYFSWVMVDDYVRGTVRLTESNEKMIRKTKDIIDVKFILKPLIKPSTQKKTILTSFIKATRSIMPNQERLFDIMAERTLEVTGKDNDEEIANYISLISELYVKEGRSDILQPLLATVGEKRNPLKAKVLKTILTWWHKNRTLRSLYLLDFKDEEINSSGQMANELYWKCLHFPWGIVSLNQDRINEIIEITEYNSDPIDIRCYEIVRVIHQNLIYSGWTSTSMEDLLKRCPDVCGYFKRIFERFDVIFKDNHFYMKHVLPAESIVIEKLKYYRGLINNYGDLGPATYRESDVGLNLNEEQKTAIQGALSNPFCIITGGAGTGKTTLMKELLFNYELMGIKYILCSPTGRAASKLKIATESEIAYTIHRAIGNANSAKLRDSMPEKKNDEELTKPIIDVCDFQVVVIDEASMMTVELLSKFFRTFQHQYRIVLVGDVNQLPPVEWGSVFDVLIESEKFPVYRLTKNLRQNNDGIINNCNKIFSGGEWEFTPSPTFALIDSDISMVKKVIDAGVAQGVQPKDIKIITPLKNDCIECNKIFSESYDLDYESVKDYMGKKWRLRDQVMMIENNYDITMFNGEEGEIVDIDTQMNLLSVKFYNNQINKFSLERITEIPETLEKENDEKEEKVLSVKHLSHSGALTVHRSQGGEWPFIIFYFPKGAAEMRFCDRRLIYTALSRAKTAIWCIGDIEGLNKAAKKVTVKRKDAFTNILKTIA